MRNTRNWRWMRLGLATALVALSAQAGDVAGAGWLDDLNSEAKTLTIRGRVFRVTGATQLQGEDGERIGFAELEELNHPWVTYAGHSGAALPVLDKLRVADPDADE